MNPLVFESHPRPQIWGHRRLADLGKSLPPGTYGESWEISAHPYHVSQVAEGPFAGQRLSTLWKEHGEALHGAAGSPAPFPLLIKFLDCHLQLSVQVHPTDDIAEQLLPGERGKTEAWVILSAEPEARIYAGLQAGVTRRDLERHLQTGTVHECLHSFVPEAGDCLFLPAGVVHAVGGGVLMAEVQQSSDATFRLFDWNRRGPDGKLRDLHVEQSLASIDWNAGPANPIAPQPMDRLPGNSGGEHLAKCRYFELDRFRPTSSFELPGGKWSIWLVLDGDAELSSEASGYRRKFQRGDSVFVPSAAEMLTWSIGSADAPPTLLRAQVPVAG
jgi:mannose-6-phosphate isomerase